MPIEGPYETFNLLTIVMFVLIVINKGPIFSAPQVVSGLVHIKGTFTMYVMMYKREGQA